MTTETMQRTSRLDEIVANYHKRCDSYNRCICTDFPSGKGVPMPSNDSEAAICAEYAEVEWEEAKLQLKKAGLAEDEFRQAYDALLTKNGCRE